MDDLLKKTIPDLLIHLEENKQFDTEDLWQKKAKQYNLKKPVHKTWKEVCEKFIEVLCTNCHKIKGRMNECHQTVLCKNCSDLDELKDIHHIIKKNMHDDNLGDMISYPTKEKDYTYQNEDDIKNLWLKLDEKKPTRSNTAKFNGRFNGRINRKSDHRSNNIKVENSDHDDGHNLIQDVVKDRRRRDLEDALKEYDLELRDDSKLCNGYINGTIDDAEWSIPNIVHRMCEMRFLYDYCGINSVFKKIKKNRPDVTLDRPGFSESLFDRAEKEALKKRGGKYPNEWPWMKKPLVQNGGIAIYS
jgi:hypothetical protein